MCDFEVRIHCTLAPNMLLPELGHPRTTNVHWSCIQWYRKVHFNKAFLQNCVSTKSNSYYL